MRLVLNDWVEKHDFGTYPEDIKELQESIESMGEQIQEEAEMLNENDSLN